MKTLNQKGSITLIILAVAIVGAIGLIGYTLVQNNNPKVPNDSTEKTSTNKSTASADTDGAEAKAQAYIEAEKDSDPKKAMLLGKELDKYALTVEEPNLTKEERIKKSTTMGTKAGIYSAKIKNGTVTKQASKIINQDPRAVTITFLVTPSKGNPFKILITTAYLDGDWRLTNIVYET